VDDETESRRSFRTGARAFVPNLPPTSKGAMTAAASLPSWPASVTRNPIFLPFAVILSIIPPSTPFTLVNFKPDATVRQPS
jgi:hypothetical protein